MNFHPLINARPGEYEDLDAIQYRLWTGWRAGLRRPQRPLTSDTEWYERLSLSYDIAKAHGSELSVMTPLQRVYSKEGDGSDFTFDLAAR